MGGELKVEGRNGGGSLFHFEIPLPRAAAPESEKGMGSPLGVRLQGGEENLRLLIAEDDPDIDVW